MDVRRGLRRKKYSRKHKSLITLALFFAITSPVPGQDVFQSIRNGDLKAVQDFSAKNPTRMEMQDINKMTPLMFASFFGQTEVAAWLIEKGADINYRRGEESCLHQAAQMNRPRLAALLLDNGADIEISKPRTPLYYALSSGARDAADLLIERGAAVPVNSYLFHNAVRKGLRTAVDYMIAKGADLLSRNGTGGTLLHSAAEGGLVPLTELMLAKGAAIDAPDRYGRCPIHLAAMNGHSAAVEQLIRKGAARDIKTPAGATAYDMARSRGYKKLAEWLAGQGAPVREFKFLETPEDLYFGLPKPGPHAEIFAAGIISSPDELEHGVPVWSPDGTEVVWSTFGRTYRMIKSGEKWMLPEISPLCTRYGAQHLVYSPDGTKLYFDSTSRMDGTEKKKDWDIWIMNRHGREWSEPENAGPSLNSEKEDRFPSVARNGNLYFMSDYDLYRSVYRDGRYLDREKLGGGINTEYHELGCFVAPDESYLIFSSSRPWADGTKDELDSYISFRNTDGSWTKPQAFGVKHGVVENFFIGMSPDRRYLFFGAGKCAMDRRRHHPNAPGFGS